MDTSTRQQVRDLLREADAFTASVLLRDSTRIDEVEAPFFRKWKIYRVDYFGPTGPFLAYIAVDLPARAVVLSGNPGVYSELLVRDGGTLTGPEDAVTYVRLFFESTRPARVPFFVVSSVEEVGFLPNMSENEKQMAASQKEKLAGILHSPRGSAVQGGYLVELFALQNRSLVRFDVKAFSSGGMQIQHEVIEQEMMVPYFI